MQTFIFVHAADVIFLWLTVTLLLSVGKNFLSKFWKKHLSKRKKYITAFFIVAFLLLWAGLEEMFSENTRLILWGTHTLLYWGFVLWSAKQIFQDHRRISGAVKRREAREINQ